MGTIDNGGTSSRRVGIPLRTSEDKTADVETAEDTHSRPVAFWYTLIHPEELGTTHTVYRIRRMPRSFIALSGSLHP